MKQILRIFVLAMFLPCTVLLVGCALVNKDADQITLANASLEQQFQKPPNQARPRVWWHWINGNISKDGIAKDLAWMKRVGIGGVQNFDANMQTPKIVDKRLAYMTPEWQDAFRFAVSEADRLGLEFAIASSPGWSETGGPWVMPQDAMKKLVWSNTRVEGGKPFLGQLPSPPHSTGPFQSQSMAPNPAAMLSGSKFHEKPPHYYADALVIALPAQPEDRPPVRISLADGSPIESAVLFDNRLETGIAITRGNAKSPAALVFDYGEPKTLRSASIYIKDGQRLLMGPMVSTFAEASDDGNQWRPVAELQADLVPTTVSFAPTTARYFRLRFKSLPPTSPSLGSPAPGATLPTGGEEFMKMFTAPWQVQEVVLSGSARVDRFETKAGFSLTDNYFSLPSITDDAEGIAPQEVINLTDKFSSSDGTLDWTPPAGEWQVMRMGYSLTGMTNHPATPEATGLEVDKFDNDAVERYLANYLNMYRETVGAELLGQRGIQALLNDSIEAGASNWTPRVVEQFKQLRGYDPTPWLPTLTGVLIGSRKQSDQFLYDFRRTLADLMTSAHYGTIAKVADEHNMSVYGEALESHRSTLGDDMAMRRFADIPMAAMWTHTREEGPEPTDIIDVRGAASVAHIYGQKLVAAESMTSAMNYWNDSPQTLKRIIDLAFVNGINRPVIHTSVHQPVDDKVPGLSLFYFGQFFNRHDSWAEMAQPWVDYMARNSLMLQQGHNVADVAYFYGEEAPLVSLYGHKLPTDLPTRYAYDFVNADALLNALANQGDKLVTPGGARYSALYLGGSSHRMTLPVLRKVAQLAENGATIVGMKPVGNPGLSGDMKEYASVVNRLWSDKPVTRVGKGRVIASTDIEAVLASINVAPDFDYRSDQTDGKIPFVHRRLADGHSYFIVNQSKDSSTLQAKFRVAGKAPELWRAETGSIEPVSYNIENGETTIPLTLHADESVHIVFRKPATTNSLSLRPLQPVSQLELSGPWQVSFENNLHRDHQTTAQESTGVPETTVLNTLIPLDEHKQADIRYFSGTATYETTFSAPADWQPGNTLWLDLGEVREVAEVLVNGKSTGHVWHAPYRIDISKAVQPGTNQLRVRVANLWVNRLIGDAQPEAKKVTWTSLPSYHANAPLRRSGLIGPVVTEISR